MLASRLAVLRRWTRRILFTGLPRFGAYPVATVIVGSCIGRMVRTQEELLTQIFGFGLSQSTINTKYNMLYKTIKKSDYSPITKLNEGVHELMFLKTDLEEVNLCKILVDVFYGNITEKYVKDKVNKFINEETDWKIKSGFTWKDYKVWLSSENQFNYKAAYDLAVQTNGVSLPVTFKFGDNDNPVYYKFTTLEELTDFYTKAIQYINTTLKEGWDKKDSIDWSLYNLE